MDPYTWMCQCEPTGKDLQGGACGVMVIVVGNRHGDPSSNPRRGC